MTSRCCTVSVLMTVWNRASYIDEAIRSIVESAFEDWELIIVDDSSRDESVERARAWASKDGRIQVHINETNLGDYPNRNRAASLARGCFLKFLDSDDRIMPHGLQVMVQGMERFDDAALGVCDDHGDERLPYPFPLSPGDVYRAEFLGRGVLGVGPTGVIIRRAAFEAAGGFRVPRLLGDWDMWLRLARTAPVVVMERGLVWWRRHEGQQIRSHDAEMFYLRHGYRIAREHLEHHACPLSPDEKLRAMRRQTQHHARRILRMLFRDGHGGEAWRLFRESGMSLGMLAGGLRAYSGSTVADGHGAMAPRNGGARI